MSHTTAYWKSVVRSGLLCAVLATKLVSILNLV